MLMLRDLKIEDDVQCVLLDFPLFALLGVVTDQE